MKEELRFMQKFDESEEECIKTMEHATKELTNDFTEKGFLVEAGKVQGMLDLCKAMKCPNAKTDCCETMRRIMNRIVREVALLEAEK